MLRTIHAASAEIRHGRLSPLEILDECLGKIDRHDSRVKAWVVLDRERAKKQAETARAEIRGHWRGPLHGIPIAVKDIIDVADLPTAAGFSPWSQSIARRDASVVKRLRQAGAVILGKVATTQFASFDPPPTRNPWNLDRTPGGSSSGSAVAVACGMCLGALGSQTGGSIIRPAAYCGVAGCKPTYGRVSIEGVVPLAFSMDHVGPIAGCVQDLAIILQAIAGYDPCDCHSVDQPVPDLLAAMNSINKPPRLARVRGMFDELAEPEMKRLMDLACTTLTSSGAAIVERALPSQFGEVLPRHRMIMAVEAYAFHQDRLERNPEEYGPKIRQLLSEGMKCPAVEYRRSKQHQQDLARAMQACFQDVDALIMPATTGPAPEASTTGEPAMNSPWSYTGFPVICVPAGRTSDGMPLAIQLVGRPWGEAELFAAATWCELELGIERVEPTPA